MTGAAYASLTVVVTITSVRRWDAMDDHAPRDELLPIVVERA